jgi:uncharacterized protein
VGEQRGSDALRLVVDGRPVARAEVASTELSRLRGLLGRRGTAGALLLTRCASVHGTGMVFVLDVGLLAGDPGGDMTVLRTTVLRPFGLVRKRRGVQHVLEAQRGAFARWGLRTGSQLRIEPGSSDEDMP